MEAVAEFETIDLGYTGQNILQNTCWEPIEESSRPVQALLLSTWRRDGKRQRVDATR